MQTYIFAQHDDAIIQLMIMPILKTTYKTKMPYAIIPVNQIKYCNWICTVKDIPINKMLSDYKKRN